MGAPIYASRDGEVIEAGTASGFGNWVVIKHDVDGKRVDSVYGHMTRDSIKVKKGDKVKGGQVIAAVGSEGGSTGPHLHYEEWTGGRSDLGGTGPERQPEAVYGKSGSASGVEAPDNASSAAAKDATCCGSDDASGAAATAGGGGGGGCGEQGYGSGTRNSKANMDQIWSFLKSKGLSDVAAAGIMGNMEQESAFMPDAQNWLDPPCRGIVQWCFDRNTGMENYAKEKGKDWTCLGTQLEFMWFEVTETAEKGVMEHLNAAKTPGEAGDVWAVEYERMASHEQAGRAERAEKIYQQYTGKDASALADSGEGGEACPEGTSDGGLVDGECPELIDRIKKLKDEGKLKLMNEAPEMEDIEKCGQVTMCPDGGHVGVEKRVLQVLITLAEQAGVPQIPVYALNKDHFCDQGEHGKGRGIDIPLNAGTPDGEKVYKYLYDNASTLGTHKLIYSPPPSGYECMYDGKPGSCGGIYGAETMSAHQDHIHVSLIE